MSDYDDGGQLDPGYTGDEQPDTFGHGDTDLGHFETGQDHSAMEQLHADHGSESDLQSQFGVFEHDTHQAESTALEHGQHVAYSAGYDEGEQPSFTGGDIDDLHARLGGLGGEDEPGASAGLGVASN
ncbi:MULTISPECIES: hypothetical protein [Dactylosporangium]|uniref:Uncharacterized protein n=2 Tax=Dactylosporangium TaxID=35753 RepID=A0A9W6KF53_9ACTN|nr:MULTISPECIES: hypothetical protein [Dactylosporangium]UAB98989.1 hypothetical protein Dvina_13460 [Dactylosporangium vinaceum]UWZ47237.1 hypothetical protein Dmats_13010 [Dactylosporangium matsuzakiense]GLK98313.1 hypothetical protein GCM10017581_000540 [Dactylosporangium matsuzakiense]